MKFYLLKIGAFAVAGILAIASGAQAGGLYDGDDNGYSGNRQNIDAYCDLHPYDDACGGYDEPRYKKKVYKKPHRDNHCRALVRAAGKRNIVRAFARNSARFAWRREVRVVHGEQFSNWRNAKGFYVSCTRHGALKSCVARGTPCRY